MEPQLCPNTFDWILLPNHPYLMKFIVGNTGYHIMLSDLNFIYAENLKEQDIQKRFHELNDFADMKSDLILMNIEKSLNGLLGGQLSSVLHYEKDKFILYLNFPSRLIYYKYEVRLDLLPANKITDFIIRPIIMGSLLCERKITQLQSIASADKTSSSNMSVVTPNLVSITSSISNSTLSSESASKSDCESEKLSSEMLVKSFAKLQSFFNQLSAENVENFNSICQENILDTNMLPKKCASEKNKVTFSGPFEYEENTDFETNRITQDTHSAFEKPLVKRQKKRNLKI